MNLLRRISFAVASLSFACAGSPLFAEATGRPAQDPAVQAAVAEASRLGELLYRYDQAAWHATDRMVEGLDDSLVQFMRGYIVVPGERGRLDAIFYGEIEGTLVEMARYAVRGSEVVSGGWLPENGRPALSDATLRLVSARQAAVEHAADQGLGLCAEAAANTIVLPPDEQDNVAVYILTPQIETGSYPLGGHYRIEVDASGAVVRSRNFLKTCMMVQYDNTPAGSTAVGMVVSHLLDDYPTEIHAFVSRYVPVSLYVATTKNEAVWTVRNGAIDYLQQIED